MTEPALPLHSVIERIAAFLAQRVGREGDPAAMLEDAATLLALIQDPDPEMEAAGDGAVWRRMIDAALIARWHVPGALGAIAEEPSHGSDEEGETRLYPDNPVHDGASWVQGSGGP